MINNMQVTWHYFVDLEGNWANGHNDEEDGGSNGVHGQNHSSP